MHTWVLDFCPRTDFCHFNHAVWVICYTGPGTLTQGPRRPGDSHRTGAFSKLSGDVPASGPVCSGVGVAPPGQGGAGGPSYGFSRQHSRRDAGGRDPEGGPGDTRHPLQTRAGPSVLHKKLLLTRASPLPRPLCRVPSLRSQTRDAPRDQWHTLLTCGPGVPQCLHSLATCEPRP